MDMRKCLLSYAEASPKTDDLLDSLPPYSVFGWPEQYRKQTRNDPATGKGVIDLDEFENYN